MDLWSVVRSVGFTFFGLWAHVNCEDTVEESPAQDPSLSICYSLTATYHGTVTHSQRATSRSVFGDVCT